MKEFPKRYYEGTTIEMRLVTPDMVYRALLAELGDKGYITKDCVLSCFTVSGIINAEAIAEFINNELFPKKGTRKV